MRILDDKSLHRLIHSLGKKADEEAELSELLNEYLAIQEENIDSIHGFEGKEDFERFFLSCFDDLPKSLVKGCERKLFPYMKALDDVSFVRDDPYYSVLKGLSFKEKGLSLYEKEVAPGELFPYSCYEAGPSPYYDERPSFAYSSKPFSYPVFSKDGRPWMSLVPHEIKTMGKAISECEGEVLTYGLGMGYFAYRACLKEDVSRVSVVESDETVISFFKQHLLPSFPKGKIAIIEGDALEFARSCPKGKYDYLFCDIYHDVEDGLPLYIELKKSEGAARRNAYWIEEDLLVYFRRYLIGYLNEQIDPSFVRLGDKPYSEGNDFSSRLFRGIHFLFKSREISTQEDVSKLLSDSSLEQIICGIDLKID